MSWGFQSRGKSCQLCKGSGKLGTNPCPGCNGKGVTFTKYNNRKVVYNGHTYDSQKEADKAVELDFLKKNGHVLDWRPHPAFVVQPRFFYQGKIILPIRYIADFWVKYPDGHEEVIDTKGYKTADFLIKAKMWRYKYKDSGIKLIIE